jgi:hypothetical protein
MFKVKDSNLFQLPNNPHMLHLGTIGYGLREFIVMACITGQHSGKCYIEEVVLNTIDFSKDVFANLKFVSDDNLAFDLAKFAEEKGLTDVKRRMQELSDMGKLGWLTGNANSLKH